MGDVLSKPVTEKVSSDKCNEKLNCGSSSMQGWRRGLEDAHSCILDYDTNTSFFAVYDGHGGHEVALYCSENLPDFIKKTEAYKAGNMKKALEDGFLGLDATIPTPEVSEVLKRLAYDKPDDESDEEENMCDLYEEATMPIDQVMKKYSSKLLRSSAAAAKCADSSFMRPHSSKESASGSSTTESDSASDSAADVVSSSSNVNNEANSSHSDYLDSTNDVVLSSTTKNCDSTKACVESVVRKVRVDSPDSSFQKLETCTPGNRTKIINSSIQNGVVQSSQIDKSSKCEDVTSSSTTQEIGTVTKKGKGKALTKTKGVQPPTVNTRPKRSGRQLYNELLEFGKDSEEEGESEDDDDIDFEDPNDESTDDEVDSVNISIKDESSEDSSADDVDENEEEGNKNEEEGNKNEVEKYGSHIGCTVVAALLCNNELYVANAGDSRCIICRKGKAVEMSFDHKPNNDHEHQRIINAGGKVNFEGRINGDLNLSRAIGDHAYKQNKELSDREQMITAFPDVEMVTVLPDEDEFIFLACDGIWDCMECQDVVDFIRPIIQDGKKKLSEICEDMFEHCLAQYSFQSGNDNMTAIIVQFKSCMLKRPTEDSGESDSIKRLKTEETVNTTESTSA